jgi:hypothetical protein
MLCQRVDGIKTIHKLRQINPQLIINAISRLITSEYLFLQATRI